MNLQHIALNIVGIEEIKNFFIDILGMKAVKNFVLKKDLAQNIFKINQDTAVYVLQKNDLFFELFLSNEHSRQGYNHICIGIKKREELINKSEAANYECIRIKRDYSDLIFINDKNGNIFEIKEI